MRGHNSQLYRKILDSNALNISSFVSSLTYVFTHVNIGLSLTKAVLVTCLRLFMSSVVPSKPSSYFYFFQLLSPSFFIFIFFFSFGLIDEKISFFEFFCGVVFYTFYDMVRSRFPPYITSILFVNFK